MSPDFEAQPPLKKKRNRNFTAEDTQNQLDQNGIHQRLSRTNNDPETEQDFKRTSALFENQKPNQQLTRAYNNYVSAYSKISSLYILHWDPTQKTLLHVFDPENKSRKAHKLKTPKLTNAWCVAILPNGELLCLADSKNISIAFIVNSDFKTRMLETTGLCWGCNPSAICFNNNIYFFGGLIGDGLFLSRKYDLDANRWVNLAQFPINSCYCFSAIFNGNIVISCDWSRNLALYSIDIDSFSTIPYDFGGNIIKLLINAERMYLIECWKNGLIYESEVGDIYTWKQIAKSTISLNCKIYGLYNKGSIYIIGDRGKDYYKFDLSKKIMFKIPDKN